MKVTMTEAICQEGLALLEGKADIFVAHDAHPHNYLDQLKDTDAFIVRVADKGAIDKETMESSDSLKVIGRTGIGYDASMWSPPPSWASPWWSRPAPTTAVWPSTPSP